MATKEVRGRVGEDRRVRTWNMSQPDHCGAISRHTVFYKGVETSELGRDRVAKGGFKGSREDVNLKHVQDAL